MFSILPSAYAGEVESESQASSCGNSGKNNDIVTWSKREKTIGNATKSEFLHPISKFPIVNGSFFYSNDQGVTYTKSSFQNMSP